MKRGSGVLLHITSLPSPHGIGTMGQEAYDFLEFLREAGQTYWQMLPLGPVAFGNSPYQSPSSCAGNPLLIDLELLRQRGLLLEEELKQAADTPGRVDYDAVRASREVLLRRAFSRRDAEIRREMEVFLEENRDWLPGYALFMALKKEQGGRPWTLWPEPLRRRERAAVEAAQARLSCEIEYHVFLQMEFYRQFGLLRKKARECGIRLIGDIPIYAAMDSEDVWSHREYFQMEEDGTPSAVAGVPPDYFSADGQLWGNPLYRWAALREGGYDWWMRRLGICGKLFDVVRIDHFRGLESYWAVPAREETARNGRWEKGPGMDFLRAVQAQFPDLEFIAEDLGYLTPEVHELLRDSGFPGMKVLEFGFDSEDFKDYQPHTFARECVVYTGTHDNTTLRDWLEHAPEETRRRVQEYFALTEEEGWSWGVIRGASMSVADVFVAQMQDYLNLPGTARMNTPSTIGGNWEWRLLPGELTADPGLARRMAEMARRYSRI